MEFRFFFLIVTAVAISIGMFGNMETGSENNRVAGHSTTADSPVAAPRTPRN